MFFVASHRAGRRQGQGRTGGPSGRTGANAEALDAVEYRRTIDDEDMAGSVSGLVCGVAPFSRLGAVDQLQVLTTEERAAQEKFGCQGIPSSAPEMLLGVSMEQSWSRPVWSQSLLVGRPTSLGVDAVRAGSQTGRARTHHPAAGW